MDICGSCGVRVEREEVHNRWHRDLKAALDEVRKSAKDAEAMARRAKRS